jgi:putative DNA-invertase from lambdoid prophage Rac
MSKTVAYVRVSTDKQDAANQEFEVRRFATQRGYEIDSFISEVVSGTTDTKYRKFGEVVDRLEAGDTLIVSEISRISRNLYQVFETLQACLSRDINIVTVKENFILGNDINSKVLAFAFGIAAEIERNMISARTKEALARKRAEGVVLGRPVGTHRPEHRKLYGKDEQIMEWLDKRVSYAAIGRLLDVNRETVSRYVRDNDLRMRLAVKRLKESGV